MNLIQFNMHDQYIKAVATMARDHHPSILTRISDLFIRDADTDTGKGAHYIVDLVEDDVGTTCGAKVVSIVCENHGIPVCDFRNSRELTIRELVKAILETSPPRSAILLDIRDNELMQKVRSRIIRKSCDLRYRRVIFCLTDHAPSSASHAPGDSLEVPGSVHDRMAVLLYHIPSSIQDQAESRECFHPLAEAMVDYTLFEPRVWRHVIVDGTLADFLSTALYQVVRRVRSDPCIEQSAYPSFELDWRRALPSRLCDTLGTPPAALCPSIHRVIPIGVSPSAALKAMEVAIPKDLPDPYAITVQSSALDAQCGSIAITQPMHHTVVNINCMIDPGILVDVCRELRSGHRVVVNEIHSLRQEMNVQTKSHDLQLSAIRKEMTTLVARLSKNDHGTIQAIGTNVDTYDHGDICSKSGCPAEVTTCFSSGKESTRFSDSRGSLQTKGLDR
jgi:hypothetical protein